VRSIAASADNSQQQARSVAVIQHIAFGEAQHLVAVVNDSGHCRHIARREFCGRYAGAARPHRSLLNPAEISCPGPEVLRVHILERVSDQGGVIPDPRPDQLAQCIDTPSGTLERKQFRAGQRLFALKAVVNPDPNWPACSRKSALRRAIPRQLTASGSPRTTALALLMTLDPNQGITSMIAGRDDAWINCSTRSHERIL